MWILIATLVRKLKMTISSVHTGSYIVLLFLDRLKAFRPHFGQFLGFRNHNLPFAHSTGAPCYIKIEWQNVLLRLSPVSPHAKGELNVPTQTSTFSHSMKIKHSTIQDYYVIKTGNRLFSWTVHTSRYAPEKTYPKNTPLLAVI